jgi:2-oxoglutarate dehydrogenase E2 component (dihydrolipoamide succinyltransferase)
MTTKVLAPLPGEGVEEITVTKWLKQEGEAVKESEPLLEANTDKVDIEIPAPASGTVLKILAEEGLPAKVGSVLALIGEPGESATDGGAEKEKKAEPPAAKAEGAPAEPSSKVPAQTSGVAPTTIEAKRTNHEMGFISPVVARIAAEHGVDLSRVQGTGMNGRITKNDVLAYVEGGGAEGRQVESRGAEEKPVEAPAATTAAGDQLIKHTLIRKQIAEHMLASKHTSPHVLTVMEADLSRVVAHRAANKETFARDGANLTFTAYFIAAIVAALKVNPLANSSWSEEGVLIHRAINVGMATSLGAEGLIVPVIKAADGLSLLGIARAVNDLSGRARAKKLQPDEVRGGTFTLTNHGTAGSLFAMPIISQPQSGILGVGVLQKRAVVVTDSAGGDSIAIRPMIFLSYVFDHRILDGASADGFLMTVKETLEAGG